MTLHDKVHHFGGDWTEAKLNVIAKYLTAYRRALKNQPFRVAYIDAFAGTGYIAQKEDLTSSSGPLFPDLATQEPQGLLEGSARRALRTNPPFDKYLFIEPGRCRALQELKAEFPKCDIDIRQGEANQEIRNLCAKNWRSRRAVLFLDPYGLQVEWTTIEAVAKTQAIDLWLLFPLGIGVNRLLKKSGDIPPLWRHKLDLLLGTTSWYHEFYTTIPSLWLFSNEQERIKANMEVIGRYFNGRLKSIFAEVAQKPGILRNSTNNPLYLLCFATGNPNGAPIAVRIAEHLLKDLQ